MQFLKDCGADINATDNVSILPMQLVNELYLSSDVLKYAVLVMTLQNGQTALMFAAQYGYLKIAQFLKDCGADIHAADQVIAL